MFVVLQCFNNLPEEQKIGQSLKHRIALTMKHAGVAISVTSATDVLAFGVGALTVSSHYLIPTARSVLTQEMVR